MMQQQPRANIRPPPLQPLSEPVALVFGSHESAKCGAEIAAVMGARMQQMEPRRPIYVFFETSLGDAGKQVPLTPMGISLETFNELMTNWAERVTDPLTKKAVQNWQDSVLEWPLNSALHKFIKSLYGKHFPSSVSPSRFELKTPVDDQSFAGAVLEPIRKIALNSYQVNLLFERPTFDGYFHRWVRYSTAISAKTKSLLEGKDEQALTYSREAFRSFILFVRARDATVSEQIAKQLTSSPNALIMVQRGAYHRRVLPAMLAEAGLQFHTHVIPNNNTMDIYEELPQAFLENPSLLDTAAGLEFLKIQLIASHSCRTTLDISSEKRNIELGILQPHLCELLRTHLTAFIEPWFQNVLRGKTYVSTAALHAASLEWWKEQGVELPTIATARLGKV